MNKMLDQYKNSLVTMTDVKLLDETLLVTPIKEGAWSIREIVGHMYGWDDYNLSHMVIGMSPGADLPSFPDHDSHNAQVIESLEGKSVYGIIDLYVEKRQEIIKNLDEVDSKTRFTIGGGKRAFSAESFVKIFVKHDKHHIDQIESYLAQMGK